MRTSRLPQSGANLFQTIKAWSAEAEATGKKLIKLSIGQPAGPAFLMAREAAAQAVMSDEERVHEYQDNGSPGVDQFARRFVQCHVQTNLQAAVDAKEIAFLPLPGIKPMFMPIVLACGKGPDRPLRVLTTTKPGYPTPADVCGYVSGSVQHEPIVLNPENEFRFEPRCMACSDLVMINYPHNPSGQVATREWLLQVCHFCSENNIRLFNDAAYTRLDHSGEHYSLTDAVIRDKFPDLSWLEMFSSSKLGNMTGWRIGAAVGSPDFIGDLTRIKGNIDSGFFAPAAAGALKLLENGGELIADVANEYQSRLDELIEILESAGMQLAVRPQAGFFSLWKLPKTAFGVEIETAEHFNRLMIERTGIVGVHFHPYIRYSVAQTQIGDFEEQIREAFAAAAVGY